MLRKEYIAKTNPDLLKMLEDYGDSLAGRFKCHRVGVITAFNVERLTVNVRLLDKFCFRDMVDDFVELTDMPLLVAGIGNSNLTFGDPTGSECLIHFNDDDIDLWHKTGEAYEPNTARVHDWSDGFVELRPFSMPNIPSYETDGTVLNRGNVKIKLTETTVEITNGSANIIMSGNSITINGNVTVNGTVTATDDVVAAGISGKGHTHSGVTAGSASTGAPQ